MVFRGPKRLVVTLHASDKAIALKQYNALMAAQTAGAFVTLGQNTATANKFTLGP